MKMKTDKWCKLAKCLLIFILLLPVSGASAKDNGLFPTEESMGYGNVATDYDKYPDSHYKWDIAEKWFVIEGIRPKIGNVGILTDNTIGNTFLGITHTMTRLSIFFLQSGFSNQIFEKALKNIGPKIQKMTDYLFDNLFWITSLYMAYVIIRKYSEGRIGEAFGVIVKSVVTAAVMYGVIQNIGWFVTLAGGVVDHVSLLVLSTINFVQLTGDSAVQGAKEQIMNISNEIWSIYVEKPWTYGQLGTERVSEIPLITPDEFGKLALYGQPDFSAGSSWKDALLRYPTGHPLRNGMIETIIDPTIAHASNIDLLQSMLQTGSDRWITGFMAMVLSILGFALFGITGGIQFAGKIIMLSVIALLPFAVAISFLADIGQKILATMFGVFITAASFKIAAAIYVAVPMVVINLIDFKDGYYGDYFWVHLIVNVVALFFLPMIAKRIQPAIVNGVAKGAQLFDRIYDKTSGYSNRSRGGRNLRTPPKMRFGRKNAGSRYNNASTIGSGTGSSRKSSTPPKIRSGRSKARQDQLEKRIGELEKQKQNMEKQVTASEPIKQVHKDMLGLQEQQRETKAEVVQEMQRQGEQQRELVAQEQQKSMSQADQQEQYRQSRNTAIMTIASDTKEITRYLRIRTAASTNSKNDSNHQVVSQRKLPKRIRRTIQ